MLGEVKIMLLTGLALKNFIHYSSSGDGYIFLNKKTTTAINYELLTDDVLIPLIIYWFDSIGDLKDKGCVYSFKNLYLKMFKELEKKHSIIEIHKRIIVKANDIYNKNPKKANVL